MAATVSIRTTREHKNFEMLKKRIRSNAGSAAYNFARGVTSEAKARVPVRTGYLREHIKWERNDKYDFTVFVDGELHPQRGAFYGVYVEYGTRNMAAQPFFRPAVEIKKLQWKQDCKAIFR